MTRFLSRLPIDLCIFTMLAGISSTRADEALPNHDQALARALENHPDIVAGKAKVALADAELYGKRMEVSRQVLGLYGSLKKLDAQIDASKAALNRSKQSAEKGGAMDQSTKDKLAVEVQMAEAQLVQTIGQREQAEKELRLLIGTASPAAEAKSPNKAAAAARQMPLGPIVEKMKSVHEMTIKMEFVDVPLRDIMKYLSDKTGVMFSVQRQVLQGSNMGDDDLPISLHTNEVPLASALQAFEDAYPEFQFVLRDYGVLMTTKDYAQEHGYLPVLELGKESATTFKSR